MPSEGGVPSRGVRIKEDPPSEGIEPGNMVIMRSVRILLKCILVFN